MYEVHGFAGLGYPFTAGGIRALDRLIDDLPDKAESDAHPYWDADDIAREIIFRAERFEAKPVVCFFAHSWGVKTGLEACWRLHGAGLKVRYFAAIDPTALPSGSPAMTCPPNVQQLDEFWSRFGLFNFPAWARRRDPLGGAGGMVRNPHGVAHTLFQVPAGHIATASHEITRRRVVGQISGIIE